MISPRRTAPGGTLVALLASVAAVAGTHGFAATGNEAPPKGEAETPCALAAPERLGRPQVELLDDARSAGASADASCAALGTLTLAALGPATPDCGQGPARRPDASASFAALEAALDWRCGRPRAAWRQGRAAVESDPRATLAWSVLGDVLRARFRRASARSAYLRALELDPHDARSLWGLASVTGERASRRATLLTYLEIAAERGEPEARQQAAARRIEFIDALGETRVWQLEKADLPGELALTVLARRPGELRGLVAAIPAGRRKLRALVDSGASGLHLTEKSARRLDVEGLAEAELFGGGGDGSHDVTRGLAPRVAVGPLIWTNALATVSKDSLHPSGAFVAIVGLDVFSGYEVEIDPRARVLRVRTSRPARDEGDPLHAEPFDVPDGEMPLLSVEGQLLVEGMLEAEGAASAGLLLLDSGASASFIAEHAAAGLGVAGAQSGRDARGYGGTIASVGQVRRLTVRVAGQEEELRDVGVLDMALRRRLTGVPVAALVGQDVLATRRLVLDLAAGTVRLESAQASAGGRRRDPESGP